MSRDRPCSPITRERLEAHLDLVGAAILLLHGPVRQIQAVRARLHAPGALGIPRLSLAYLTPSGLRLAASSNLSEAECFDDARGDLLSDAEVLTFCTGFSRPRLRNSGLLDAEIVAPERRSVSNHVRLHAETLLRQAELT